MQPQAQRRLKLAPHRTRCGTGLWRAETLGRFGIVSTLLLGSAHIAPLRSGAMRKLVFKEGPLLVTGTHPPAFLRFPSNG